MLKEDSGDVSHAINFYFELSFPDRDSCGSAQTAALAGGYVVDAYKSPIANWWTCTLHKSMPPTSKEFEKSIDFARELATRFGGVYTGTQ